MSHIFASGKTFILPILLLVFISCVKDHSLEITPYTQGSIIISYSHKVKGETLKFDTLRYSTSTGNRYQVSDLQYFTSRISLHSLKGKWHDIKMDDGIHYTDARDSYSCSWWVKDLLPPESFDSVAFIFGLDALQNTTGRFPDPPERDMFWPDILGGGYHSMKMNLKWQNDTMPQSMPFMFHLGTGQVYASGIVNPDSIIGYVPNSFRISLPIGLDLTAGGYHQVILEMNVDRWFDGQNAFEFARYPSGMMQNQEAMFRAIRNGKKVFTVKITN
ncbi:MAG: hypothetical protein NTW10_10000 [Bacteroidetes bacterium]|nr:hypothetical protein [Bacteroidota bacterium]